MPAHDCLTPLLPVVAPVATTGASGGASSWWSQTKGRLSTRMSEKALSILEHDAMEIAGLVSPMAGNEIDTAAWGDDRVRTGIVVGSVQSGKTGSMIATSAMLLDNKIGILVILSGTQIGLWIQTLERVIEQLDGTQVDTSWMKNPTRVLIPNPGDVINDQSRLDPYTYTLAQRKNLLDAISKSKPIIVIIPKIEEHMAAFKKYFEYCLNSGAIDNRETPLVMAVFDDEADDASVLDSQESDKLTPRRIESLWKHDFFKSGTGHPRFYVSYVAYTATPQANFLQSSHNPLAPRDFSYVLRTGYFKGQDSPRGLTYTEPNGLSSYYTGAEIYYELISDGKSPFTITFDFLKKLELEPEEQFWARFLSQKEQIIGEAIRSFLVGAAIRLAYSGKSIKKISNKFFKNRADLISLLPEPHSMLYHPSSEMDVHFSGARELSLWSQGRHIWEWTDEDSEINEPIPQLDPTGLANRLEHEDELWRRWFTSFHNAANDLRFLPMASFPYLRSTVTWELVKQALVDEVFPSVKTKVINSNPLASDRPSFSINFDQDGSGQFSSPDDLLTIFIAGNVLSRGVTIEGLATSIFLRAANEPAADTQMQMQRWFGYRGKILPLCRLFIYNDQFRLFREYHDADEATKIEILNESGISLETGIAGPVVLHGASHWATRKVASRRIPLHPGPSPSIRLVEQEDTDIRESNLDILKEILNSGNWINLEVPAGKIRGIIRQEPMDILAVADYLELFSYSHHQPSTNDEVYKRWESIRLSLDPSIKPLLRLPAEVNNPKTAVDPSSCPYSIAAYLRLWSHLANFPNYPGFRTTEESGVNWRLVEPGRHKSSIPKFYIGVRFGELECSDYLLPKKVRAMTRGVAAPGVLKTLWGTRGTEATYLGDQYFDYHLHHTTPLPQLHNGDGWRPLGHPGLVLFHVIRDTEGRETVATGLSLPRGGPDHFAALRE